MRLCVVRGSVVLNVAVPSLRGKRLVIVEPITADRLKAGGDMGGGKPLIAVDQLGPAVGQVVGVAEGRTAANPYWPEEVPVDAYCALIVQQIEFHPPEPKTKSKSEVHS
jgi:microcompartment protein CcmK/EutM